MPEYRAVAGLHEADGRADDKLATARLLVAGRERALPQDQAGTSSQRSAADPLNVQRKTTPPAFAIASWIATRLPNHGCHRYNSSRKAVPWAFPNLVVQSQASAFEPKRADARSRLLRPPAAARGSMNFAAGFRRHSGRATPSRRATPKPAHHIGNRQSVHLSRAKRCPDEAGHL
jgi:hypothetical protein